MLKLKKAEYSDIDFLYELANDQSVRQNSFNTGEILYETHKMWFSKMMVNPSIAQFILVEDDYPVGQIRLDISGSEAEISYSISPEYRGKGYGRAILQMIKTIIEDNYPEIKTLIAKVKPNNLKSKSLFEGLEYDLKYLCYTQKVNRGVE